MKTKTREEILTGGLSHPSKMPCAAYSLPAKACKTGSELRKVEGSTCSSCYAMTGNYRFANVQAALNNRLQALRHPRWAPAMITLIGVSVQGQARGAKFFRSHDSGDLQSFRHLLKIVSIARRMPDVKFWLPTREAPWVLKYLRLRNTFPRNLVVRVSAPMVDKPAAPLFTHTSTVTTTPAKAQGWVCPASKQDNACRDCRACWDGRRKNVAYPLH